MITMPGLRASHSADAVQCCHRPSDPASGRSLRSRRAGSRLTALALAAVFGAGLAGCAGSGTTLNDLRGAAESALGQSQGGALSADDITRGLKEALAQGSDNVVAQLGQAGGFASDPEIRIPLPASLVKARGYASKVGLEQPFDDLEARLNAAAEAATPKAKALFLGAIQSMSVDDARGILQGPDDAATQYFRNRTETDLSSQMRPIVDDALAQVGAVNTFNSLMQSYRAIPMAPKVDADLTGYVVDKSTDGIFHYLAQEEAAIRNNPVKRTSELLRQVFGSR